MAPRYLRRAAVYLLASLSVAACSSNAAQPGGSVDAAATIDAARAEIDAAEARDATMIDATRPPPGRVGDPCNLEEPNCAEGLLCCTECCRTRQTTCTEPITRDGGAAVCPLPDLTLDSERLGTDVHIEYASFA